MIRKSVKHFSVKIMLNSLEPITFIHPGLRNPDGS